MFGSERHFCLDNTFSKCNISDNNAFLLQYLQIFDLGNLMVSEKIHPHQNYKTLKDFAKIVSLFNNFEVEERSVSEISKMAHMLPSKISRMLRTLEGEGYFEKNQQTGKYRLGIAFFELGIVYVSHFPLRKLLRPLIEQMAKELNLTASWGILKKDKVLVIDRVQNLNIDLVALRLGYNLPLHTTSIGKTLLAYLPKVDQNRIFKSLRFEKFTTATITDAGRLKEELIHVREQGYAVDRGETHEDLNCIAVPIRNSGEEPVAALNIMGERARISIEDILNLVGYLKEKALFISRQIGFSGKAI